MKIVRWSVRSSPVAALLVSLCSTTAFATSYSVQSYSLPGYEVTNFWGINDSGTVVGSAQSTSDALPIAFTFSAGAYTVLSGPAGSVYAGATGISNGGTVVGNYSRDEFSPGSSFIYESGTYTDFSIAGAVATTLRGISSDGRYLAGTYADANFFTNGFIYDRSNGAQWTIENSIVQGVNNAGLAVGSVQGSSRHPFTHDFGADLTTTYTPSLNRYRGVNDHGSITGFSSEDSGTFAFVGLPGSVDLLPALSPTFSIAYGINSDGWVVGFYGADPEAIAMNGFIARPVPEPATWGLALAGLVALGSRRAMMPART